LLIILIILHFQGSLYFGMHVHSTEMYAFSTEPCYAELPVCVCQLLQKIHFFCPILSKCYAMPGHIC